MTRIVLEHDAAKLAGVTGRFEVCDSSGRTVGYFIAVPEPSLYKEVEVPVSEDELRQAEKESGGHTTAEVLARLRSLEGR